MEKTDVTQNRVAVLGGGWSDERDISMQSAQNCAAALHTAGFDKVDVLDVADPSFIQKLSSGSYNLAFVAMHGRYGEDGCIQGLLETLHIPYTFSGVLACAVGNEKEVAKGIFKEAGIPVPNGVTLPAGKTLSVQEAEELVQKLGLPLFVKPAANGSSFGVTRVTEVSQLPEAISKASSEGDRVLIETCVTGTEITVPVIGNDEDAHALPIVEIAFDADFYDVQVKYEPASLHHVIPARIPEDAYHKAEEYAVRAHRVLGCRGVSRSDFIVTSDGTPTILEINVIPGMTERSLLPDSARHAGIEFPELCRHFVELALEEHGANKH